MRSSESRSGTPRGSETVTIRSNSQKSRVGSASPCSCPRLHMMSVATEPPRCVCSSARPCSNIRSSLDSPGRLTELEVRQDAVERPRDALEVESLHQEDGVLLLTVPHEAVQL